MTAPGRGYVAVMRDNDYPTEVSDPEASGLPDTADDDSTAYDEVEAAAGPTAPDPAALPGVGPGGSTRFGNTAEEARAGRVARLPARAGGAGRPAPRTRWPPGRADRRDDRRAAPRRPGWTRTCCGESPTSDPNSAISIYDDGQLDDDGRRPVGRLVDPDEGYGFDHEADSVAYDAGAAGGGASAEELAMHETQAPGYS